MARIGQTPWISEKRKTKRPQSEKKQITRPRDKQFKLKKLLPQSKKVHVKENGRVVRTMKVNRQAHYFSGRKNRIY